MKKHYSTILSIFLDLALLKINPPLPKTSRINVIQLNDAENNLVGKKVKLSGWGKTENENDPSRLRATSVKVSELSTDRKYGKLIGMSYTQDTGLCQGDSGGKFVFFI